MEGTVVTILLVDDNKFDTKAIRRSFRELKFDHTVIEARSGTQAMTLLRGDNGYKPLAWPFMVLLDLNMPDMTGLEFLKELRGDPNLRRVTVFVISGSESSEDRTQLYDMNIAGFIPKPGAGKSFLATAQMLQHYIRVTEFPDRPNRPQLNGGWQSAFTDFVPNPSQRDS